MEGVQDQGAAGPSTNRAGRRSCVINGGAALLAALLPAFRVGAQSAEPLEATLVVPGPGSAVSAIPELAVKTGADRLEGLSLRLKFVEGGGIAMREIYNGNAQFGVFGATAAMRENLAGPRLVALAAIENRAPLALLARADLRGQVRSVEDLRGRVLGIHTNSLTTMTNGQQFMILVLRVHSIDSGSVRFVASGQSWESQSSALRSRLVDAIVSEEPIASRLESEKLAFALLRLGQVDRPAGLPGEGFLRGTLIAEPQLVAGQPGLAGRVVRTLQRALAWRRDHTPEQIVAALGLDEVEARAFAMMLRQYPDQFSVDGRFSAVQIEQTDRFFRESSSDRPEAQNYRFESMIVDRWVGRAP
jgi:NitT/TauT family transport system substrate-binding protein